MMKKFRICVNKYKWYKIQIFRPASKLWKIFTIKEKWVDTSFKFRSKLCTKYRTREEASKQIKNFMEIDQRQNDDWNCE